MVDLTFNTSAQKALRGLKGLVVKDDLRPSLSYISFRDGYLYAIGNKAQSLIRVPLNFYGFSNEDADILNGRFIFIDDLLELAACERIEVRENEMLGYKGNRKILCDYATIGDYPAVEGAFPSKENSRGTMCINVRVMNALANAFVETRRIIAHDCYSEGDRSPVLLVPYYGDSTFDEDSDGYIEQEGVIMPFAKL
jgi:hypothetical protein